MDGKPTSLLPVKAKDAVVVVAVVVVVVVAVVVTRAKMLKFSTWLLQGSTYRT